MQFGLLQGSIVSRPQRWAFRLLGSHPASTTANLKHWALSRDPRPKPLMLKVTKLSEIYPTSMTWWTFSVIRRNNRKSGPLSSTATTRSTTWCTTRRSPGLLVCSSEWISNMVVHQAGLICFPKLGDVNDRPPTLGLVKSSYTFHICAPASNTSFVLSYQQCFLSLRRDSGSAVSLGVRPMVRRSCRLGSQFRAWLGRRIWSVPQ